MAIDSAVAVDFEVLGVETIVDGLVVVECV